MRTLNEQIQRLRDALVTCYKAIKEKGGSIPEAGERNMTNLPAAVASIPQTHGVLKELEVTANGEYQPADYNADGFSKVTAKFDTSSLPKVKVSTFKITNECLDENGVWQGASMLDVSEVTSFSDLLAAKEMTYLDMSNWDTKSATSFYAFFNNLTKLKNIDVSKLNLTNVNNIQLMFSGASSITYLDVSKWDVSNITSLWSVFGWMSSLEMLDLTTWDISKVNRIDGIFAGDRKLKSLIGNKTLNQVIESDEPICCLKGLSVGMDMGLSYTILDTASILALVNGLADLTGQTEQTLTLGSTIGARLDTEQIAGVPAKDYLASKAGEKNWTIAY